MNIQKALTTLVAGAALALLPVLPSAAHASAQPQPLSVGCTFTVHSVTARNLLNDGGADEVALRLDDTWFPSSGWVSFSPPLPRTRSAATFGDPVMGFLTDIDVRLSINGFPFNHPVDRIFQCSPISNATHTFNTANGDAIYDVKYSIT